MIARLKTWSNACKKAENIETTYDNSVEYWHPLGKYLRFTKKDISYFGQTVDATVEHVFATGKTTYQVITNDGHEMTCYDIQFDWSENFIDGLDSDLFEI